MALILYPDGTSKEIQPRNGSDFQLDELHDIVSGYIEVLPLKDGRIMVVNEEGKLQGLPRNEQATKLVSLPTVQERQAFTRELEAQGVQVFHFGDPLEEDYVTGTVLVCESNEVQ